jgi:hypothetical protein
LLLTALAGPPGAASAADYLDAGALGARLRDLASSYPAIVRVESAAESLEKRPVWRVELGAGEAAKRLARPAMLVVAGVEGTDLAGSAAALAWIERLARQYETSPTIHGLLDAATIYVFPRLNPDAAEKFFALPVIETSVNTRPTDDDHDGITDEDGNEDLNGDKRITWMRVKDPEGTFILDPLDPRLLMKADPIKGEVGAWKMFTEGRDDDRDEQWNEDGPGGVNLNRNFPFQYNWFAADAGVHQVSEPVTRMLADFVIAHPNIAVAFTFGAADNLLQAPRAEGSSGGAPGAGDRPEGTRSGGPRSGGPRSGGPRSAGPAAESPRPEGRATPSSINDNDLAYYRRLGELYRKSLGLKDELQGQGASQPGSFSDWIYFHRGRLSLAAQPWSPAMQLELEKLRPKPEAKKPSSEDKKTSPSESPAPSDAAARPEGRGRRDDRSTSPGASTRSGDARSSPSASADKRNEQERAFLKWLDKNAPDAFVAWKEFKHPDFPDRRVEIGGFAPFAKTAPPKPVLDALVARHADFLTTLALQMPRVAIRSMTSKHLGQSVYEVKIQVENTGWLPTVLAQGETTREINPTRLTLDLDPKAILSGTKITRLPILAGSGGMQETRYILHVPDRSEIKVTVVSALGGTVETSLKLDGEKR